MSSEPFLPPLPKHAEWTLMADLGPVLVGVFDDGVSYRYAIRYSDGPKVAEFAGTESGFALLIATVPTFLAEAVR